ncbi:hypothetical protein P43SY_011880 [Pythium insidiosum]|uniref:Uncharacterized protein n=1 Tax=Pythium insidiosum TaxID=114742 RepID=A0AAD5LQF3_PYTIN|nr:hypothetical protein P43SY_011880 [Pythium insidiosum]
MDAARTSAEANWPTLEARRLAAAAAYEASLPPTVDRPAYKQPKAILRRPHRLGSVVRAESIEADLSEVDWDQRSEGGPGDRRQEASTSKAFPVMEPPGVTSPIDWTTVAVASLAARGIDDIPTVDQADLGPTVFIHEGADMAAEEIEGQIPEVPDADRDISIEDVQVATGEDVPAEWVDRVKQIVWGLIPEVPDADRDISIEDVQVATGEDVPADT